MGCGYLPFEFLLVQVRAEHSVSGRRDSNPNLGGRGWVGLDYSGIIGVALSVGWYILRLRLIDSRLT